jgi:methylmalonyl-CoA mutase cobalamin-binding subunit
MGTRILIAEADLDGHDRDPGVVAVGRCGGGFIPNEGVPLPAEANPAGSFVPGTPLDGVTRWVDEPVSRS